MTDISILIAQSGEKLHVGDVGDWAIRSAELREIEKFHKVSDRTF